jgi:glycosyltransferase involved in cell wall biosynthesis
MDVSVIVSTRNRWPFVATAIQSVLAQEGVDLELIVVDDASTDETRKRLQALGDPRVLVLHQPVRQGVSRSRNKGMESARGRWVAFLDDDDFWAPHYLRAQLDTASGDESFIVSPVVAVARGGSLRRVVRPQRGASSASRMLYRTLVAPPSAVLAKAAHVRDVGGSDPGLSLLADWDLWLRLGDRGAFTVGDRPLVAYRLHDRNMHVVLGDDVRWTEFRHVWRKRAVRDEERPALTNATYFEGTAFHHRRAQQRFRSAYYYVRAALLDDGLLNFGRAVAAPLGEGATYRLGGRSRTEAPWVDAYC